jgi:hypothetical protein
MNIERFEDIKAWQEARELVKLVYNAIGSNREFMKDLMLSNFIKYLKSRPIPERDQRDPRDERV